MEELLNNFNRALQRFRSLKKRLQKDPKDTIRKDIKNGYARKLSNEEIDKTSQRAGCLSRHPVSNAHKPNKIRIDFDPPAEHDDMSLSKALVTGPDLLNNLTGILLRLRNSDSEVATAADIEAMYHQGRVSKSDAEALRFLWLEDLSESDPEVYQMVVHIFGAKDSPWCANCVLKKTGQIKTSSY